MNKAFTIAEIMAVIVILGILAVLAVPRMANQQESSIAVEAVNTLILFRDAQQRWAIDNAGNPADCTVLDVTSSGTQRFNAPVCSGGSISIQRQGGAYTVTVDSAGTYSCSGTCPFNIQRLYP